MNLKPKHLKPFWNKKSILLVSLALIFAVGAGVTTAWLTANDGPEEYTFAGAFVDCDTTFTAGDSSASATVKNTGNVDAYVRATVIFHYREKVSGTYGGLHPAEPVLGKDYQFSIKTDNWITGADGYYYHKSPVIPNGFTADLIETFKLEGGAPEGYEFRMEVLAEAIQAEPGGIPAREAWGVILDDSGNITDATGIVS